MWYLDQFKKQIKGNLKLKSTYKDLIKEVKKTKELKTGPSVKLDTSKEEFEKRYSGLRATMFITLFIFSILLFQIVIKNDYLSKINIFVLILINITIYYKMAFTAWRARCVYNKWNERNKERSFYFSEYNNLLLHSFVNIFPIKLKK